MESDKLFDHVENLAPGVLVSILTTALIPRSESLHAAPDFQWVMGNPFVTPVVFLVASYLTGVVVVLISRLIIDRCSRLTFRPWLLVLLHRRRFELTKRDYVNEYYGECLRNAEATASQVRVAEIQKRRQSGRLVRSAWIPASMLIWVSLQDGWWFRPFFELITFGAFVFLYAYSEVATFEACRREDFQFTYCKRAPR